MQKQHLNISLILVFLILFVRLSYCQKVRDLAHKEVFNVGFPKSLYFREDRFGQNDDFENWEKYYLPYNAITKKYLNEEISISPKLAQWANQFAAKHPEKLMLLHFNGECMATGQKGFFPGHWVYDAGTFLVHNVAQRDTVLHLKNAAPFSLSAETIQGGKLKGQKIPHSVIIVPLLQNGEKDWYNSEYATVTNVDYTLNQITVRRAQFNSSVKSFSEGAYVAPIAADQWGEYLMWYYNLSTTCPVDAQGKNCADRCLDNFAKWFGKGGELENLDGIGYDVNYFEVLLQHKKWDLDVDGMPDRGIFNGKNLYRLGNWDFIKKTRKYFGDEFIITADGWDDNMQKAVGVMNGMESEGICRPYDAYRQIATTINEHRYWNLFNTAKYKYNYITSKLMHVNDVKNSSNLTRFGLGVATCLGASYTGVKIPEMTGGNLKKSNWLGMPVSDIIFPAKKSPDLFNNAGVKMSSDFVTKFNDTQLKREVQNNELHLSGTDISPYKSLIIEGPEISVPSGDVLIFLEAKAIKGLVDFSETDLIPRKLKIKLGGLPVDPAEPKLTAGYANSLLGFIGTADFMPLCFYFRNVGTKPLRIILEVEEQGEIAIRNFTVHNTPLLMMREFEKGLVVVNASTQANSVNIKNVVRNYKSLKHLKVDESDINKRDSLELQYQHKYNNGQKAAASGTEAIPVLNAVFYSKQ